MAEKGPKVVNRVLDLEASTQRCRVPSLQIRPVQGLVLSRARTLVRRDTAHEIIMNIMCYLGELYIIFNRKTLKDAIFQWKGQRVQVPGSLS